MLVGPCHHLLAELGPTSHLGACFVSYAHPHPTESSMGAKVAEAAGLRSASFGPGAGSLPAVHGVGGHDATGRHEPPGEQLPGAGGHGAGAGAGDAAGKREAAARGRGRGGLAPRAPQPQRDHLPPVQATAPQEERHDVTTLYHRMSLEDLQNKFGLKVSARHPHGPASVC